jgi:stage II sporulation protein D
MNSGRAARWLLSAILIAGIVFGDVQGMSTPNRIGSPAASSVPAKGARYTLRVGVWTLWHDREVAITPGADAMFRACARCDSTTLAHSTTVRADGSGLTVAMESKKARATGMWLSGTITLTAHGETQTLRNPVLISARDGLLVIAVTLPVEKYVEKVVASESGGADSAESLRALAIVVRTFALHEVHGHADYDVCDSTHCQLLHWNGNAGRRAGAHSATLATAGETLWFHAQRALAYFNKDCGGRTSAASDIWPTTKALPYLSSRIDRYCTSESTSDWNTELTLAELTHALSARGLARPGWQSLIAARRAESGRVVTLKLDGNEVNAEEFRLAVGHALGWNRLPSTWFEVIREGDRFRFHGRGWGHGVGLCQKGAAAMAAQKMTGKDILAQYFPGSEPADEATGQAWKSFAGSGFTLETLNATDTDFLPALARTRDEASRRSGLNSTASFTVRAFGSTSAFRGSTLAPGWMAAFTEGDWIAAQPLKTLHERRLLDETMRHEFVHALVEREAGATTPLWLREGLAEAWSGGGIPHTNSGSASRRPAIKIDVLDSALVHAGSLAESQAAHRAAAWYAAKMLERYGRAQLLAWLRSGVPGEVIIAVGQR